MSGEILFLAHRVPFPPDRGDKIRSHYLLRHLATLAPVHVGCFADETRDLGQLDALDAVAASRMVVLRDKALPVAGLEALARGLPVSLTAFRSNRLAQWVARALAERPIGAVVVFSGQMGQYVPADYRGRLVVDLCDVDSAKFEAYAADAPRWRRWIDAREGRLLAQEEARLARRADATLLISEPEAALLRGRLADPGEARIAVIGNGIDTQAFDPARVVPHRDLAGAGAPQLVFTGQMDYPPNVAAVQRTVAAILPLIRQRHSGAMFHIVGRAPSAAVRHLAGDGVVVWGEVPDVRPFLAGADLVLAPLMLARGVQNKVLEAMAMARPVVLTSGAATGISAQGGTAFAVADSDAALAEAANALLSDAAKAGAMGRSARAFVITRHGWDAMLAPMAGLLGMESADDAR